MGMQIGAILPLIFTILFYKAPTMNMSKKHIRFQLYQLRMAP